MAGKDVADLDVHPIPRSALLFMATVDEARRTNEGPFRAIAPIFRIALEPQRGQLLNVGNAAAVLSPILGPNFTQHALEAFIPQLEGLGWLVRVEAGANQAAYRVPGALPPFDEDEAVEASTAKLERLYAAFGEFLDVTAPLLKVSLKLHEFQWYVFRWATSLDGMDKDAVKAHAERLSAGEKPSVKNAFLDEPHRFNRVDKSLSVEFAGFVKWLVKHNRPEIADVASLTELGLALEFIEELRSPTAHDKPQTKTAFVLDAPVLLDLLGLSGPSRQASIKQSLNVLRQNGASVVTLTHCLDELSEIINTVLDRPEARRFGLTGDALRENPRLIAIAQQVARQPDQAAKLADVEVLMFDLKSPLNAARFPDELIDRFRNTATWHDQSKTEQRERDAMSVAFVMRRRARFSSDVLDADFVLVVRNSTFTRFSEVFVKKNLPVPAYAFGPAIETKTLAAFVWMRFGSVGSDDLPQMHLISACDRILATNGEMMRKAERKLKELKGEAVAAILLSSQQAVLDLVIAVGGNPDVLDGANGDELLNAMTSSAAERGRLEERARADEEQAKLTEAIAEQERAAKDHEARALSLAQMGLKKDAELRSKERELLARDQADALRAEGTATRLIADAERQSWLLVSGAWIGSAALSVLGQFFIWQGLEWWKASAFNAICGVLVILITLVAIAFNLRWVPPGRVDLAATLQAMLVKRSVRRRLGHIEPMDERDRVREVLRVKQALNSSRRFTVQPAPERS